MTPHSTIARPPLRFDDLLRRVEKTEGFEPLVLTLTAGRSGSIDGTWGSSGALAAAALGLRAPQTLLLVIAFPRDLDGWAGDLATFAGQPPVIFPAWDNAAAESDPLDEIAGQRLRVLKQLESDKPPRFVLTTMQALLQPVPDRRQLAEGRRVVRAGEAIGIEELSHWLIERGYKRGDAVELPGEFSRRGGLLDVYSPDADSPYRLEFFGDEIESIRQFAPQSQRSLGKVEHAELIGTQASKGGRPALVGHLCDYLPNASWALLAEPDDLREQGKHYLERVSELTGLFSVQGAFQQLLRFPSITVSALPSSGVEKTCHLRVESVERFSGDVNKVRDELDGIADSDHVVIACHNEAEAKRLGEVLASGQLAQTGRLDLLVGHIHAGFRLLPSPPKRGRGGKARSSSSATTNCSAAKKPGQCCHAGGSNRGPSTASST